MTSIKEDKLTIQPYKSVYDLPIGITEKPYCLLDETNEVFVVIQKTTHTGEVAWGSVERHHYKHYMDGVRMKVLTGKNMIGRFATIDEAKQAINRVLPNNYEVKPYLIQSVNSVWKKPLQTSSPMKSILHKKKILREYWEALLQIANEELKKM